MAKQELTPKERIVVKTGLIYWLLFAIALLIVIKVVAINLNISYWDEEISKRAFKESPDTPVRGSIYDTNGKLLSTSVPYFDLYMDLGAEGLKDSTFKNNVEALADSLSVFPGNFSKEQYLNRLRKGREKKSHGFALAIGVDFIEKQRIENYPILNINDRNKSGLVPYPRYKRTKPFGNSLLRKTLGLMKDGKADFGLEEFYNTELSGESGLSLKRKLTSGVWEVVEGGMIEPVKEASDIITAIDIQLQDFTDSVLHQQLKSLRAQGGLAMVMEVQTGYIKAISTLKRGADSVYRENKNYAIEEFNEPGSTFKIPVLMAVLEDGEITPKTRINLEKGTVTRYGIDIRDDHAPINSDTTVSYVIPHSSNVGMVKIVDDYYVKRNRPELIVNRLKSYGFNEKTGIDLADEVGAKIKSPGDGDFQTSTLMMMSHGYEVEVTPLQVLTFYNAIANNGMKMKPKVVRAFRKIDEVIENKPEAVPQEPLFNEQTLKYMKKMLRDVVVDGTARRINTDKYQIAGKTGTAKVHEKNRGYSGKYRASFVGYFPADKPLYSCIVVVFDIDSSYTKKYYGSVAAAPVFRKISDKLFTSDDRFYQNKFAPIALAEIPQAKDGNKRDADYLFNSLGIKIVSGNIKSEWISTMRDSSTVSYRVNSIKKGKMPDVKGMGAKDAVYLLEVKGLKVVMNGYGTVRGQFPDPGTDISKGQLVKIILK